MGLHKNLGTADIHGVVAFNYSDEAARTAATGFAATDVFKIAHQDDDDSLWILIDDSPITWVQVGSGASSLTGQIVCRYVTTSGDGNLALSGLLSVDGSTTAAGDVVLVSEQTDLTENGVYVVSAGAWTRLPELSASAHFKDGLKVWVGSEGTDLPSTGWSMTVANPFVLGTNDVAFARVATGMALLPPEDGLNGSGGGNIGTSPRVAYEDHAHRHGIGHTDPDSHVVTDGTSAGFMPAQLFNTTKQQVRVATTVNITLSGTQTIDTISLSVGNRVLVKNQNTGADNGIYEVGAGAWARATDYDSTDDIVNGTLIAVTEGAHNGLSLWTLETTGAITPGSTALVYRCIGDQVIDRIQIPAGATDEPVTSDWAVNATATFQADSANSGLSHVAYDDTTEQGRGFELYIPPGTVAMRITLWCRAQSTPPATRTVGPKLYKRLIGNGGTSAVSSWESVLPSDLSFTNANGTNWQPFTRTVLLTDYTTDMVAGYIYQFELTRVNPAGGTELVGNMNLKLIVVEFI